MPLKRWVWQLYPSYFLITLTALIAMALLASWTFSGWIQVNERNDMIARAQLIRSLIDEQLTGDPVVLDILCKRLGTPQVHFSVFRSDGAAIADTDIPPSRFTGETFPEVVSAITGKLASSHRYSKTLGDYRYFLAMPVIRGDSTVAVIRVSEPIGRLGFLPASLFLRNLIGFLIIGGISATLFFILNYRLSRQINELRSAAERFAQGDFDVLMLPPHSRELGGLFDSMNRMAEQLDSQIKTITSQYTQIEAILSSMMEGVVAIDSEGRVISLNRATAELFHVHGIHPVGRLLIEVIRNSDLHRFVLKTLESQESVEGEVRLYGAVSVRVLQAHGTVLRGAGGERTGAVVVLNDVTVLRALEKSRSDFVANVSHELRTPITSIKGFVEMLLEGAIKEPSAADFLAIIERQAEHLNDLIEDLLSLARIERETEQQEIALESQPIREILDSAAQLHQSNVSGRGIEIDVDCPEELTGWVNRGLLQQAVSNLIDNAIRYSHNNGLINVRARREGDKLRISVEDFGCGIGREHLPRIFERFYRVDKSRSRKGGGTGLGLAIVKHIALAHNGEVSVTSHIDQGSVFTIEIPV